MVDATPANRALEALLASAPDTASAPAGTIALDERVEFYLRAVHGAGHDVTAAERALARERILGVMAAAIAETGTADGEEFSRSGLSPAASAMRMAATRVAAGGDGRLARILSAVRRVAGGDPASPRWTSFSLRGMCLVAAPLLLIVAGAVWRSMPVDPASSVTQESGPGIPAPAPSARATRSLAPPADADAEERLEREVAIAEARGGSHPDLADALVRLADFCQAQARHGAAAVHYERALAIRVAAFGPSHPAVEEVRARLSASHRALGRPQGR
jgi:hypothetical protein